MKFRHQILLLTVNTRNDRFQPFFEGCFDVFLPDCYCNCCHHHHLLHRHRLTIAPMMIRSHLICWYLFQHRGQYNRHSKKKAKNKMDRAEHEEIAVRAIELKISRLLSYHKIGCSDDIWQLPMMIRLRTFIDRFKIHYFIFSITITAILKHEIKITF